MDTATKNFTPAVFFHPGIMLDEKMKEMNLGIKEFAALAALPERTVWDVTSGNASITADMALALEQATHIPATMWIRSQHLYDDYRLSQCRNVSYLDRLDRWQQDSPRMVVAEDEG